MATARTRNDRHQAEAADLLVIFGITGDLAHKMTFRALYRLEHQGLDPGSWTR